MNAEIERKITEIEAASRGAPIRRTIVDALSLLNESALPHVTAADAGKVLTVDGNGQWIIGEAGGGGDIDVLISRTSTSVASDTCESVGTYSFYNYHTLQSVDLPAATLIGGYAFRQCASLQSVSLPAATSIGDYAFGSCISLRSVSLPAATLIGSNAFASCSGLRSVSLPVATTIRNAVFAGCISLQSVALPAATSIGNYAFEECSQLQSLTLGASTVCSLGSDSLDGTPSSMRIYVPADLVNAYKAAPRWSAYASQIMAI